jgi:erythromycin esterase
MIINKRWFIAYFVFFPLLAFGQKYDDNFNLGFEYPLISSKSSWVFIPDAFRIGLDSIEKVQGKNSFLLSRTFLNREFTSCLFQTILLPKSGNKIEVSIQSKSLLLQSAWLRVNTFDKNKNFIKSDSIPITNENIWKRSKLILNSNKEISVIDVEIWAREPFKYQRKRVKIWLDDMQILVDGVDLLKFDNPKFSFSESEKKEIQNPNQLTSELTISMNVLKTLGNSKIFGFGESTHGCREIEKSVFENIKLLISKKKCRLVLLELPIDIGIRLNQYVQEGRIDENVIEIVSESTFDTDQLSSFLDWIKNFNISAQEKVAIFGIDRYVGGTQRHINNFLINKELKSNAVDSLLFLLNSHKHQSIPFRFGLNNARELTTQLQKQNYLSILQYLKNRTDSMCTNIVPYKNSGDWNDAYRDCILWQNTKFAIENFSSKNSTVAIYAHLSHLNKKIPIFLNNVKSLGQYISDDYGKDYYLFGMLCGEGTISVKSILNAKYSVQKIDNPVQRSIESLCSFSNETNFFKEVPLVATSPILIRKTGAFYLENQQFAPSFVPGSMNAIIYINKSSSSKVYQRIKTDGIEVHDLYQNKINYP